MAFTLQKRKLKSERLTGLLEVSYGGRVECTSAKIPEVTGRVVEIRHRGRMPCGGWLKTGDFASEKRQHEGWYGVGVLCVGVAPWNEGQISVQYNDAVSR